MMMFFFLQQIISFLQKLTWKQKAKLSFIEGIGQGFETIYNGKDTNLLFKAIAEGKRKEVSRAKLGYKSESSQFENEIMKIYKEAKAKFNGEVDLAKLSQGHDKSNLLGFGLFFSENKSKRQIFIMLFDLIRLVHKDLALLDENSFNEEYDGNYKNYTEYKYYEIKNLLRNV